MPRVRRFTRHLSGVRCGLALLSSHVPCGVELPNTWNALEFVFASLGELDFRPDHQVLYRATHQSLARVSLRGDTGCEMDGDTPEIVSAHRTLPGVQARPDLQSDVRGSLVDGSGASPSIVDS